MRGGIKVYGEFHTIIDLKQFARDLAEELDSHGVKELADEVRVFQTNYFSSSSEYMGEFRIVLNLVSGTMAGKLPKKTIEMIQNSIEFISHEFQQRVGALKSE